MTPELAGGADPLPEDEAWRPGWVVARWAALPLALRGALRRYVNPSNLTRLHLADQIRRRAGQFVIGGSTYGRPKIRFAETGAKLRIGRYGSIADNVEILLGGNHRLDWVTTYPFPALPRLWPEAAGRDGSHATNGDVNIGHDVWLGSQCLVLSGVTIGHGAVVAARAVVTRDVPPYAVVAGNPARIVRYRLSEEQIAALLAKRWWDRPEAEIGALIPILMSDRIETLPDRGSRAR